MSTAANPYAPPSADLGSGVPGMLSQGDAVAMRQSLLKHEASVKAFGALNLLSAGMLFMMLPLGVVMAIDPEERAVGLAFMAMGLLGGVLFLKMGLGMRRFDSGVKWMVGLTSGVGLLNPPVGTLINAYILYLVFGEKGKAVFSEEYQRVIEQTPEIKYQTPMFLKVLVGVLILSLLGGISVALMS